MDTTLLLAGSLGLSTISLPAIMVLYKHNIRQEILLSESRMEKLFSEKLDSFKRSLEHKKLAISNINKISKRLLEVVGRVDPDGDIFTDFED